MRSLPNWIDSFSAFTSHLPSPEIFRTWAGIAAVAGALERKVWVWLQKKELYPNMYTVLVAPPGVGKTVLISRVSQLWGELENHHLASSSLTKAALIDELNDAKRQIMRPKEFPNFIEFNSLLVPSNELGVLIPSYDSEFMNVLTDIWDGHGYSERRRSKEVKVKIPAPQLNIIAGTTPSYLNGVMPEGAWDQGFISRVILVYSGETFPRDLFDEESGSHTEFKQLAGDLRHIGSLFGKMFFTEESRDAFRAWHLAGGPPAPEHPRLRHYTTRRSQHLAKLMMIASASRGDDLTITLDDYHKALGWLLEVEHYMTDIFRSMASGGDAKAMEAAWYYVMSSVGRLKVPVSQDKLVMFLAERVPSHSVERIIDLMVKSKQLKVEVQNGLPFYRALPRTPQG